MTPNIFLGHERFSPCTLTRVSFRGGRKGVTAPLGFFVPPPWFFVSPLKVMGVNTKRFTHLWLTGYIDHKDKFLAAPSWGGGGNRPFSCRIYKCHIVCFILPMTLILISNNSLFKELSNDSLN